MESSDGGTASGAPATRNTPHSQESECIPETADANHDRRNAHHVQAIDPHDFPKSKNRRRCDVSRNSRLARSDIELSRNDIEVRANDIEKAHSVDFRSHSVAK